MSDFSPSEHMAEVERKKDEALEKIKEVYRKLGLYSGDDESEENVEETGPVMGASRELIEELKDLEEQYRLASAGLEPAEEVEIPATLGEEPLTYVHATDEELAETARNELRPQYVANRNEAKENYSSAEAKAAEETAAISAAEAGSIAELNANRRDEENALTESMVIQGLVNSTIFDQGSDSVRRKYAAESARISSEYDMKYAAIRSELELRQLEYENALSEYDLSYAAELRSRVSELKREEEARLKEINEYNRELAEREAEYQKERQEALEAIYLSRSEAILNAAKAEQEYEREYGVSYEKQAEYVRRYTLAKNFYSRYTASEAGSMIEESEGYLRLLLGDEMFTELARWNFTERG